MAREKLFPPEEKDPEDDRKPYEKFSDLASKIMRVPKATVDEREKEWQRKKKPS